MPFSLFLMFKEKITSLPLSPKSYYEQSDHATIRAKEKKKKKIATGVTKQLAGHKNANGDSEGRGYLLLHSANTDF